MTEGPSLPETVLFEHRVPLRGSPLPWQPGTQSSMARSIWLPCSWSPAPREQGWVLALVPWRCP